MARRKNTGGEDHVRQYLNSIGKMKLLSAEDEVRYGRQIKRAQELEAIYISLSKSRREVTKHDIIRATGKTEQEIKTVIRLGEVARRRMWLCNLRLVVSIAKKYSSRGFEFIDLIQIGSAFGLERAVEKFDPEKGYKFSTYATWWIRQAITRDIAKHSRLIRLPVYIYNRISQVKKATRLLHTRLGRPPTATEIATHIQKPREKYQQVLREVLTAIRKAPYTKSLDHLLGEAESGASTMDYVSDDVDGRPEAYVQASWRKEKIHDAVNQLDNRKRYIMIKRHGLDNNEPLTLRQLHEILGISRERVRQLQLEAEAEVKKYLTPYFGKKEEEEDEKEYTESYE